MPCRGTSGRTSTTTRGASPFDECAPRSVVDEGRGIGRSRAVRGSRGILRRIRRSCRRIDLAMATDGRRVAARMFTRSLRGARYRLANSPNDGNGVLDVAFFLVFWPSPEQHLLMTVCPYELGIPAKIVTNTRTESAFPRTSHAPLTLASSTMSAFVQSAFTTGGSTFVRARAQTRRAPTARVRPRISVANAHSNSRSDNTNRPYLLSSLQASGRVSLRVQAIAEGRQSLFVTVNVKPGKMEEYESLIKSHSESTKPHRSIHLPPDAHLPNRSHELLHERQVHVL